MKKQFMVLALAMGIANIVIAQNPPLRVAAALFAPPFSMKAGRQQMFGFDIDMMQFICKELERECQFTSMPFANLIPALLNNKTDTAVGAIAITIDRSKQINFSIPYLPSHAQFLAANKHINEAYSASKLLQMKIGVEEGTVFKNELLQMGIKENNIVLYRLEDEMIDALGEDKIDLVLVDAPTAKYWDIKSGGHLKTYGGSLPYGYGLGIAINPNDPALVTAINRALQNYQNSPAFKKHYETYFGQ